MAFAHLGNRGTASSKSTASFGAGGAASVISLSPNQTIPVGSFVVVWAAGDSYFPSGSSPDVLKETAACYDSAGNVYVTIAGWTDGQDNIYSQIFIFVAEVHHAITTSDTIDVYQLVGTLAQVAPRAMSVHEFSVDPDKLWAIADAFAQALGNRAADPGAISFSGGKPGQEYLILHGLSAEGPNTDAYTWDSDYTQISGDGTTGGAADSNIHLRGGFRIATITSDTVDVTSTTADRDYSQVLCALTEVGSRRALSFPRNPTILDDFNRADENPVAGGWDTGASSPRSNGNVTRHLRITSNQLRDSSANPGLGGSWFTGGAFTSIEVCDGFDAFMTFAVAEEATLSMRGKGKTEDATADGIAFEYVVPPNGQAIFPHLIFGSLALTGRTDQQRGRAWISVSDGWKVGVSMVRVADSSVGGHNENYVYFWIHRGSSWEVMFTIHGYDSVFSIFNTTTDVKIGVGIDGTPTRIDDVGGGPTYNWCHGGQPQFIRRPWRYQGVPLRLP